MQRTMTRALDDSQAGGGQFDFVDPPAPVVQILGPADATAQSLGMKQPAAKPGAPAGYRYSPARQAAATVTAGARYKPSYAQEAVPGPSTAAAPSLKDADYDVAVGDAPDPERDAMADKAARPLANQAMYEIIRQVSVGHSGDPLYSAVSADREFSTPGHGAYQKRHFGLGFGILLFTQESGQLGAVLQLMHDRDPERFTKIFGDDSDSLLGVTNADTPEGRLQPVGGESLTSPNWIAKFQAAGNYAPFQAAQNEQAIEGIFRPILHAADGFGLTTDRLLAMALDVAVGRGVGGAVRWLAHHVGPFETAGQRYHAMDVLGLDNLESFQAEVGWTPQDGQFGPETHAALAGALRRMDVLPMPKSSDLACRMVARAEGALKERLLRLRDSQAFSDQAYDLN